MRLGTYKTKGMGTSTTTLAMAFTLIKEAKEGSHKITRWQQLELVRAGRVFKYGEVVSEEPAVYDRTPMGCPYTKLDSIFCPDREAEPGCLLAAICAILCGERF